MPHALFIPRTGEWNIMIIKINSVSVGLCGAACVLALSMPAQADGDVYAGFPVTVKGYSGSAKDSVSYKGQIARHVLHDSLKKLAAKGNGKANPGLKAQMMSYYTGKDAGRSCCSASREWHPCRSCRRPRASC